MNLFERIKRIFIKEKIKAISDESTDIHKIVLLATREHDAQKVLEILTNHVSFMKSSDIIQIISHLPMKNRVEAIKISNKYITPYDLAELSIKKLNYEGKIEILQKFENRLDLEDIYQLFNSITPDQRFNALKKCVDRFDSYGIAEIIDRYIPLYERLDALNMYRSRLDGAAKASIIQNIDDDRKIIALKTYAKEINRTDLEDIVCSAKIDKVPDILDVTHNYLSAQQIADVIRYNVSEERKLEMLYKCCYKLDSAIISDLIKFTVPQESREEALIALQNRMDKTNVGEVFQFCTRSLSVFQKIKHNLDSEDVEYFKNNLK